VVRSIEQYKTFDEALSAVDEVLTTHRGSCLSLAQALGLDATCDFQGADMRGINFAGEDLRGFDFSWADLSSADLRGTGIRAEQLRGAKLDGALLDDEAHIRKTLRNLVNVGGEQRSSLYVVTSARDTSDAFDQLVAQFERNAIHFADHLISWGAAGRSNVDTYWRNDWGIWGAFDREQWRHEPVPRYLLCFGVTDPGAEGESHPTVEMNPPLGGEDLRVNGAFVRDIAGRFYFEVLVAARRATSWLRKSLRLVPKSYQASRRIFSPAIA